jgi:hypothetical protein
MLSLFQYVKTRSYGNNMQTSRLMAPIFCFGNVVVCDIYVWYARLHSDFGMVIVSDSGVSRSNIPSRISPPRPSTLGHESGLGRGQHDV